MSEGSIPKIFHQIWLGKRLPRNLSNSRTDNFYRKWHNSWLIHNPDWKFVVWNDDRIKEFTDDDPEFLNLLNACQSFSEKSDLLRFKILEKYGGVYIDTDFECLKSIDPLLKDKDFVICKENSRKLCGAFVASTPHHSYLRKIISKYHTRPNYLPADWKYGPWFITNILGIEVGEEDGVESKYKKVYPYGYQEMWRCHENFNKTHPEAYAVHHWMFSWSNERHAGQHKYWF